MEPITHTVATVTVAELKTYKGESYKNPNDVDFIVKYPEGYSGKRIMPEGLVVVSKEAAKKFTEQGIGSVAGPSEEKAAADGTPSKDQEPDKLPKDYNKLNKEQLQMQLAERKIVFDKTMTKADLISILISCDSKVAGPSDEEAAADGTK